MGYAYGSNVHDCNLAIGGDFAFVAHETIRESPLASILYEPTVAHELGHCFGLSHGDNTSINACLGTTQMELMTHVYNLFNDFIDYHQNIIRSRKSSPGK